MSADKHYDLSPLHSPYGRDAVGPMDSDRVQRRVGYLCQPLN